MLEGIYIDINCDVGEGFNNEEALMPYLSSCNIACGGHAGDEETMLTVAKLAHKCAVKVGAHPSYPDQENFGRISLNIDKVDLIDSIEKQMSTFVSILKKEGIILHHIKPHGALYNDVARDAHLAKIFLKAIEAYKGMTTLYAPFGSVLAKEAQKSKFPVMLEAFADRNYNKDYSLVSRKRTDALISSPKLVLEHLVRMVKENHFLTQKGANVYVEAETFCVHGDTPSALEILSYLSSELPKMKININK